MQHSLFGVDFTSIATMVEEGILNHFDNQVGIFSSNKKKQFRITLCFLFYVG